MIYKVGPNALLFQAFNAKYDLLFTSSSVSHPPSHACFPNRHRQLYFIFLVTTKRQMKLQKVDKYKSISVHSHHHLSMVLQKPLRILLSCLVLVELSVFLFLLFELRRDLNNFPIRFYVLLPD